MNTERIKKLFPKAESLIEDKKRLGSVVEKAFRKASDNKGALGKVWDDLSTLLRMIRLWIKGEYTEVPWRTGVFGVCALMYLVNPMDFIPDIIPVTGFIDDATVIGFFLASIKKDLDAFRSWELSRYPEVVDIPADSVK
ncbi:MAG: YkvA family protein [Thermodesulfobacteriota bacterium]